MGAPLPLCGQPSLRVTAGASRQLAPAARTGLLLGGPLETWPAVLGPRGGVVAAKRQMSCPVRGCSSSRRARRGDGAGIESGAGPGQRDARERRRLRERRRRARRWRICQNGCRTGLDRAASGGFRALLLAPLLLQQTSSPQHLSRAASRPYLHGIAKSSRAWTKYQTRPDPLAAVPRPGEAVTNRGRRRAIDGVRIRYKKQDPRAS